MTNIFFGFHSDLDPLRSSLYNEESVTSDKYVVDAVVNGGAFLAKMLQNTAENPLNFLLEPSDLEEKPSKMMRFDFSANNQHACRTCKKYGLGCDSVVREQRKKRKKNTNTPQ